MSDVLVSHCVEFLLKLHSQNSLLIKKATIFIQPFEFVKKLSPEAETFIMLALNGLIYINVKQHDKCITWDTARVYMPNQLQPFGILQNKYA